MRDDGTTISTKLKRRSVECCSSPFTRRRYRVRLKLGHGSKSPQIHQYMLNKPRESTMKVHAIALLYQERASFWYLILILPQILPTQHISKHRASQEFILIMPVSTHHQLPDTAQRTYTWISLKHNLLQHLLKQLLHPESCFPR